MWMSMLSTSSYIQIRFTQLMVYTIFFKFAMWPTSPSLGTPRLMKLWGTPQTHKKQLHVSLKSFTKVKHVHKQLTLHTIAIHCIFLSLKMNFGFYCHPVILKVKQNGDFINTQWHATNFTVHNFHNLYFYIVVWPSLNSLKSMNSSC